MSQMRINEQDIRNADIFETILDNFPDIIHSVDDQGNIVFTNRTAERMLGYSRAELLAMNIRQLYAPEILAAVERGFSDLKKDGTKRIESMLVTKAGEPIPVEIRSFGIYDDQGTFLRTFSILRDIRKIKELEDGLVHAGRLAAIGEMAAGVAHDINQPLTVIQLANDMAQYELASMTGEISPQKRERLQGQLTDIQQAADSIEQLVRLQEQLIDIQRAADSIQQLVRHLRDFSRGTAETLELVDLNTILNDAAFIATGHFVTGSPNRLIQIFVNLIANGCDAMAGVQQPELKLTLHDDTHDALPCWRCDVTDNGCGIDKPHLEKLFQSFFTTKPKGKGTGLGLSIARGIARDHKGDITVKSALGKGTTFSVYLPKAAA
jgi:PAS domain S-box-containing protein